MILSPVTDEPVYPSNVVFTTTNTKHYNLDKDHCYIRLRYLMDQNTQDLSIDPSIHDYVYTHLHVA